MADPSDSCRELALHAVSAFVECGVDMAPSLPRLFAVVTARLPAVLHHDGEAGLFIYDEATHDAHRRGKAVPRQVRLHHPRRTLGLAFFDGSVRNVSSLRFILQDKSHHAGSDAAEPSEAVRHLSLQVLHRLLNASPTLLRTHLTDAVLFAQLHLQDSFPVRVVSLCLVLE